MQKFFGILVLTISFIILQVSGGQKANSFNSPLIPHGLANSTLANSTLANSTLANSTLASSTLANSTLANSTLYLPPSMPNSPALHGGILPPEAVLPFVKSHITYFNDQTTLSFYFKIESILQS